VLALLQDEPAHGWAIAAELAPGGPVGAVWSLTRPLVYRALELLEARGLVEVAGAAVSTRGPNRTLLRATPAGHEAVERWLDWPVEHVRDIRPDLLLKLVFAARLGRPTEPLLRAQKPLLERVVRGLEAQAAGAEGTERIVLDYRLETARAALRFVEAQLGR
jgi:DNA-binding PadR family transcriptional regulator